MAIVFQNSKINITIDSNTIIGVMGRYYEKFISALVSDNVFYLDKRFSINSKRVSTLLNNSEYLKEFSLDNSFLDKNINELSHSELKILKYLLMLNSNKTIIVIDEPFQDLDYSNKKKITLLLNKLIKQNKTIIISSIDSNIIYSLCKKVLFINSSDHYYGNIDSFKDKKLLKKYQIEMPNIMKFIELAESKKIKLKYSQDIRELIKDVYRNVS